MRGSTIFRNPLPTSHFWGLQKIVAYSHSYLLVYWHSVIVIKQCNHDHITSVDIITVMYVNVMMLSSVCHHTQDGWSALMMAARCGHTAVVQELVKSGATLDIQNKVCYSPV